MIHKAYQTPDLFGNTLPPPTRIDQLLELFKELEPDVLLLPPEQRLSLRDAQNVLLAAAIRHSLQARYERTRPVVTHCYSTREVAQ